MATENHRKYLAAKTKYGKLLANTYGDLGETPDVIFDKIAQLDPSSKNKNESQRFQYLEWVCSRVVKDTPRVQDLYKIHEDLSLYTVLARLDKWRATRPGTIYYRPFVEADLGQYKTLQQLSETILPYEGRRDRKKSEVVKDAERKHAEENSVILFDGPEGRIVSPKTKEASQYWGRMTKWCISATKSGNFFDTYYKDGKTPVLMFLPKGTTEKFAFNENDQSSARNVLDRGVYAKTGQTEALARQAGILSDFASQTITSPLFAKGHLESDPYLLRALQIFCVYHPPIYAAILEKNSGAPLPAGLAPDNVLNRLKSYLREDCEDYLHASNTVGAFISHEDVITHFFKNREDSREMLDTLAGFELSQEATQKLMGGYVKFLMSDDKMAVSKKDWLENYTVKAALLNHAVDKLEGGESIHEETFTKDQFNLVPDGFWADEEFCVSVLEASHIPYSLVMDLKPHIFDHPQSWLVTMNIMDSQPFSQRLSQPRYAHLPSTQIDGKPFIQALLESKNSLYQSRSYWDLHAVQNLYDAYADRDDVDLSPLVAKIEELYPKGFDNTHDIEAVSECMPRCDFSGLLEKSVKNNPALFADVDPARQTLDMVKAALTHDPESLADVADRFFQVEKRPSEMADAFKRMVAMESPYVGMVERHFNGHPVFQP